MLIKGRVCCFIFLVQFIMLVADKIKILLNASIDLIKNYSLSASEKVCESVKSLVTSEGLHARHPGISDIQRRPESDIQSGDQ